MKYFINLLFVVVTMCGVTSLHAEEVELTGDTKLACEALLCLSSSTQPSECAPGLQRYYSISSRKLKDTIQGRIDFLNQCPSANQTSEMTALVQAMANGAGRCDAASLNATLTVGDSNGNTYISNVMPSYCSAYTSNQYTDLSAGVPFYVGTPERGGYWVEQANYAAALAAYNAALAAQQQSGF